LHILREQRNLTLRQLAETLGVQYTHLNTMENGQKRPSTDLVLKISHLFEVTTDQLMKDELELD
jgi:transcriptional regulator with XRE-family HTH domain